jgi:hypothetical protein
MGMTMTAMWLRTPVSWCFAALLLATVLILVG